MTFMVHWLVLPILAANTMTFDGVIRFNLGDKKVKLKFQRDSFSKFSDWCICEYFFKSDLKR